MTARPAVVDRALNQLTPAQKEIAVAIVDDFLEGVGDARTFYQENEAALARVWSAAIEMARGQGRSL